jgi:Uma2 family endonuclease
MATHAFVPISEYLATSYHPDREYVDGAILERNVGEYDHSRLQGAVTAWFYNRRRELRIQALPEQRVQVSRDRFRIPDVCVTAGPDPGEQILTSPPLICIEIISRDDRMIDLQAKIDDYLDFGVPNVWLIDPRARRAWHCTREGMHEVRELRAASPEIAIPLPDLFD